MYKCENCKHYGTFNCKSGCSEKSLENDPCDYFCFNLKPGMWLRIIAMNGEARYTGKVGQVKYIDDAGQVHGTWGGCALLPDIDFFDVLTDDEVAKLSE